MYSRKKIRLISALFILFAFLLCPAGLALAQNEILLGIVNLGTAIDNSKQGAAANKKVQKKFDELSAKLQAKEKELQAKVDAFNTAAPTLTPEERSRREADLEKDVAAYQAQADAANTDMETMADANYGPIYDKAVALVGDIASQKGLAAVLENSSEDKATIYSASYTKFVDITDEVTAALDKKR
jgi:outer membrane protein